jgi:hypothetical protein
MNSVRINNFRMAAYAAFAVGIINLRYQTGAENNLGKSAALFIPGALLLLVSLTAAGKKWLESKTATAVVITIGGLLLIYSFVL